MKKLLSAVTSTVMGVSLMTGAFVPPVSAAGGYAAAQPNISMDGALDVAANKTDDGGVVFDFGNYETEAGKKFNVAIKVNTNNAGVAAMDVNFKIDSPLKITGIAGESPAFEQSVLTNMENYGANFTAIENGSGAPIVPDTEESVFIVQVEVPAGTAAGDYKISFGDKSLVFRDASNNTYPVTTKNGTITVKGSGNEQNPTTQSSQNQTTTSTTTKPNNTTTTTKPAETANADVIFDFGSYKANAGDKVTVNVKADTKNNGVAAMDVVFKVDSPLVYKGVASESPAFEQSVLSNPEILGANFTAIENGSGAPIVPDPDESTFILSVEVPADTPDGVYHVGFGDKHLVFKDASNNTLSVSVINGDITVGAFGDNTSSSTQTTTKTTSQGGQTTTTAKVDTSKADVIFDFGNYQTEAGQKVNVNVKADTKNNGVAAMDVIFKVDSPLVYKGVAGESPAFEQSVLSNVDILGANFTAIENGSGAPIVPDPEESTFIISIEVPAGTPDGDYYVGFGDKCLVFKDASNNTLSTAVINGKITVGKGGTQSTSTSTSKENTTTSTTISGSTTDKAVTFDFQNYKTKAGEKVKVEVLCDSASQGIAGMDVNFKIDSPLTISGISTESPAFEQSVLINLANLGANFTAIENGSGAPIVPATTDAVFILSVDVPAGTAAGDYNIGFGNKVEVIKDNTNALYSYTTKNGVITVEGDTSTASSTSTTSTTSKEGNTTTSTKANENTTTSTTVKADPVNGAAEWVIPKVTAAPGETVKMDIVVKDSAIEVAGAQFNIKPNTTIGNGKSASGNAYDTIVPNDSEQYYAFGQQIGKGVKAADNAVIISMSYTVPTGTAEGVYPITWANAKIFDTNGNNITDKIKLTDGSITVTAPVTGEAEWVIPKVTAAPGETVKMDVIVKNSAIEVAGAQFNIKPNSAIGNGKSTSGNAYDTIVPNDSEQYYAFGQQIGKGVKAADNAVIISMSYTVPADTAAGEYPITWDNVKIFDTNGNNITDKIKLTDGSITIVDQPVVDGKIKWVIPTVYAKPGDTVDMDVTVSGTDAVPVAGAQFNVKGADGITYTSIAGSPYGAAIVNNDGEQYFAFARANGDGTAAANGDKIFTISFKVPDDASGEYPVTWANAKIFDTNGKSVNGNIELVDGAIIISETTPTSSSSSDTTTTTTTTTKPNEVTDTTSSVTESTTTSTSSVSTTTSSVDITPGPTTTQKIPEGHIAWKADTVTAVPGSSVKLNIEIVDTNGSKLPIAGGYFTVVNDNAAKIKPSGVDSADNAYGGSVVFNPATNEYAFANNTGKAVASENGKTVVTITYDIAADCADGEYPVDLSGIKIYDADGKDISDLIEAYDGLIIVASVTPTTTTTTATTSNGGDDTSVTTTVTTTDGTETTSESTESTTSSSTTAGDDTTTTTTTVTNAPETSTTTTETIGTSTDSTTTSTGTETVTVDTTTSTGSTTSTSATTSSTTSSVTETGTGESSTTTSTSSVTGTNETTTATTTVSTDAPVTNTTTDVTTVSTTPTTTAKGAVIWQGETVSANPGQTVKVKFLIEDDQKAGLPVAGAQFNVNCDLSKGAVDDKAVNAYGASIVGNPATGEYAFANPVGAQIASEDGKTVIELEFAVPEGTAPGEYPVAISGLKVFDKNGTDITDHVIAKNGKIVVNTTTTSSTGTSTTATSTGDVTSSTTDVTTETTVTETTTDVTGTSTQPTTSDVTETSTETTTTGTGTSSTTSTDVTETSTESTTTSAGTDTSTTTSTTSTSTVTDTETTTSTTSTSTETNTDTTSTSTSTDTDTTTTSTSSTSTDTTATSTDTDTETSTTSTSTTSTETTTTTTTSGGGNDPDPGTSRTTQLDITATTDTGTTTYVTIPDIVEVTPYYSVEFDPGFYFSHDTGVRGNGEKGGFDINQITHFYKHTIVELDGKEVEKIEELPLSELRAHLNFGDNTPNKAYHDRFGSPAKNETVEASDFVYEIPLYYDDTLLLKADKTPVTVTAYIGVKGDTNLDFIVDGRDATATLTYYAVISTDGHDATNTQISPSEFVKSPDDALDNLAALLSDVDENEWAADNWSKKRADRLIDGRDATNILTYYSRSSVDDYKDYDDQQLWDTVVPDRFK